MTRFFQLAMLSVVTTLVLISCATTKVEDMSVSEKIALTETTMPVLSVNLSASTTTDNSYQEPKWTKAPDSYNDTEYKYFSGSSDITFSDKMARQYAMTDAASSFARWLEQSVNEVVNTTTFSSIVDTSEQKDAITSEISTFEKNMKSSASAVVSGLEAVDYWKNPQTGELWILTRVSKKLLRQQFQSILDETSALNEFGTDEEVGTVAGTLKDSFEDLLQKEN